MLLRMMRTTAIATNIGCKVGRWRQSSCVRIAAYSRQGAAASTQVGSQTPRTNYPSTPSAKQPQSPNVQSAYVQTTPGVKQTPPQQQRQYQNPSTVTSYPPSKQQQVQPAVQRQSIPPPSPETYTAQQPQAKQPPSVQQQGVETKSWDAEYHNMTRLTGKVMQAPGIYTLQRGVKAQVLLGVKARNGYADSFKVILWDADAELIREHVKEGMTITVVGELEKNVYKRKDTGATVSETIVRANQFWLIDNPPADAEPTPGPAAAAANAEEGPKGWDLRVSRTSDKMEQCWRMYHENNASILDISVAQNIKSSTVLSYIMTLAVNKNFPVNWVSLTLDCALSAPNQLTLEEMVDAVAAAYEANPQYDPMKYEVPISAVREQLVKKQATRERFLASEARIPEMRSLLFAQAKLAQEMYRFHLMGSQDVDYRKISQEALASGIDE